MASQGPRRPLHQAAQHNLRSTQETHRQHLQAAVKAGCCTGSPAALLAGDIALKQSQHRPPQLPGASPLSGGAGSRFQSDGGEQSLTGMPESPRSAGPRAHHNIREARSFSAEAFRPVSPSASPSVAAAGPAAGAERGASASASGKMRAAGGSQPGSSASSRTTPRTTASPAGQGERRRASELGDFELPRWAARSEADDEEMFVAELDELEDLCQALNIRSKERHGPVDFEPRPLTSGTSPSASTTAPSRSTGFEIASADFEESPGEPQAPPESDNPFDSLRGGQRASYELQQCGSLPHGCRIERTPGVPAQFFFSVDAAEGPYAPATLTFWIKVFNEFPAVDGISIRSTKRVFHPHVQPDTGHFQLQRECCGAESRLKDILVAIRRSVLSPTDSPAANADAAILLQTDPEGFRRVVRNTLAGGEYRGSRFDKVLEFAKERGSAEGSSEKQRGRQMSDQMKVQVMQLDVMQAQFKAFADKMITENNTECRELEASLHPV